MNTRTLTLLIGLLATLCVPQAVANKKFKPLKAAVKTGQGVDAAIKLVATLEKDSTITKPKDQIQLAQYAFELYDVQFKKENELQYLKRSYDTVRYFNAILGMYTSAERCYLLEEGYSREGRASLHYSSGNHGKLLPIITNLNAAGHFYYKKKKWAETTRFFNTYFSAMSSPLFIKYGHFSPKMSLSTTAYLATHAYASIDSLAQMMHYGRIALEDSTHTLSTYRLLASTLQRHKDTARYTTVLEEALLRYPEDHAFFGQLSDVYLAQGYFDKVLHLADTFEVLHPEQTIYTFVKSIALLKLERYTDCINASLQILDSARTADTLYTEAYYNIGYSYSMLAEIQPSNATKLSERQLAIKTRNAYYAQARPYLEEYRRRRPAHYDLWYPLLYNIYFKLNLGRELQTLEQEYATIRRQ